MRTLTGCRRSSQDAGEELNNFTREKTSPDAGEVQHETNLAGGLEELNQQPPRTFTDADLTRDLETLHRMPRHLTGCESSRVMPRHLTGCGGMITRTERNRRGRRHPGNLTKTLQNLTEPLTPNRPERNQPERRRRGQPMPTSNRRGRGPSRAYRRGPSRAESKKVGL